MDRRLSVMVLATLALLFLLSIVAPLAAADNDGFDTGFGGFGASGVAALPFEVVALARQPDGELLAAGTLDGAFAVTRLLDGGGLDPDFGQGGLAVTRFGEGRQEAAVRAMAVQDDGAIVLAGEAGAGEGRVYALARYTPQGAPDPGFDADGMLLLDIAGAGERAAALAIGRAGRLLVGGWSAGRADDDFVVVGLRPDGSRDGSFGGDGERRFDFGGQDRLRDILVQPDGKVVLFGDNLSAGLAGRFALARLSADGLNDMGFGKAGALLTSFGTSARASSIALQGDRLVAVGGGSSEGFLIARYRPNGALDLDFDQDGVILAPLGRAGVSASAALPLADGGLIVVGRGTQDLAVARFESGGAFAPWFGDQGRLFFPTASAAASVAAVRSPDGRLAIGHGRELRRIFADGSADAGGRQVAAPLGDQDPLARRMFAAVLGQPDGGLLTVGTVYRYTPQEVEYALAVTRHLPGGQPDRGFGANGELILTLPEGLAIAGDALLQPDGKLVIAGTSGGGKEDPQLLLLRLLPDGSTDPGCRFALPPAGLPIRGVTGTLALQADGKLLVAGAILDVKKGGAIFAARFLPDCTLDASFGAGGTVVLDAGLSVADALALPDGRTLLAGRTPDGLFLVRLDAGGRLDREFGDGGTVALPLKGTTVTGAALAGERVLVSAYQHAGGRSRAQLLGFRGDGSPDPSFGVEGTASVEVADVVGTALARRDDGPVALVSCPEETGAATVAVFTANGAPDRSFSDDGTTTLELGGYTCLQGALFSGRRLVVAGLAAGDTALSFGLASYALGAPRELGFAPLAGPVREGETATLTVRLSQTATRTVTVRYAAEGGSATNGVDFRLPPGTLTFAPGQTSQSIGVPIIADGAAEPDERVTVALSAPANAVLGPNATLTLTIADAERPGEPAAHTVRLPLVRR